jgi:hypothetical protein
MSARLAMNGYVDLAHSFQAPETARNFPPVSSVVRIEMRGSD